MAASRLGHLIVSFKGQFYFIPEEKIGPPVPLPKADAKVLAKALEELKAKHPEDFVDTVRIAGQEHLLRLVRRN